MNANYFNQFEFKQAFSNTKDNPLKAKYMYEEYLSKYPSDYNIYTYYSVVLITLGQFDEAEKIINYVEEIANNDQNFCSRKNKLNILKQHILFNRLKLLCYQEKYHELNQLCVNHSKEIKCIEVSHVDVFCKKKIDELNFDSENTYPYLFRQINDYKESEFMDHIKKHLANYNQNIDKPNKNIFVPNFPIDIVIEEIKKYIPSDKAMFPGFIEDSYIFKYNECGRQNNRLTDYFKVISFHKTADFITMLPVSEGKELEYVDLNYLIPIDENVNVKRLSQIQKFNNKYGQIKI